jgi:hypothetical protein
MSGIAPVQGGPSHSVSPAQQAQLAAKLRAKRKRLHLPTPGQVQTPNQTPTTNAAAAGSTPSASSALTAPPAPAASGSSFDVRV